MRPNYKHKRPLHKRARGAALITALFITALAAIMATALAVEERLLIHEGELAMNADTGYLALQAMRDQALLTIEKYVVQWPQTLPQAPGTAQTPPAQPQQAGPLEVVALPSKLKTLTMNGETVVGTVVIEQGKFNINDLAYSANQANFVALLQAVKPGVAPEQAYAIAKAITAWITTAENDPYYATLNPPYRSAKNQLTDISELRLIMGVTPDIFTAISPYITALPIVMPSLTQQQATAPVTPVVPGQQPPAQPQAAASLTPLDINSVSVPALMAVNLGLNVGQAQSIIDCRNQHGAFATTQAFMSTCAQPSGVGGLTNITAQSTYFLVQSQTIVNNTVLSMNSLLVTHVTKDNKLKMVTVWQAFQ